MNVEEVKPNKPSFALVGLMAAAAIIVILVAAAGIVAWRAHQKNKTPYTKRPVSQLRMEPAGSLPVRTC